MAETSPMIPSLLMPLSPTYMPYFERHRSPSNSSSNTRQREDYEQPANTPIPTSIEATSRLLPNAWDDEDEEAEHYHRLLDRKVESYPASELPFASEPALETELEQELPPLKKLKSASEPLEGTDSRTHRSTSDLAVLGAVKGILTRREGRLSGSSTPAAELSLPASPGDAERCFSHWSVGLGVHTINHASRPLSRRSSSGASSAGTGASLKAVRFASGNGFLGCWERSATLPLEIQGPVAAVMYLTHSAEAYDRSPIVVEDGLRLPPRAKKDLDEDNELEVLKPKKAITKMCGFKPLTKLSVDTARSNKVLASLPPIMSSSPTCTHDSDQPSEDGPAEEMEKCPTELKKWYRDVVEEEEDEEEESEQVDLNGDAEDDEEEGFGRSIRITDQEDEEDEEEGRGLDRMVGGGFGQWCDSLGYCDALGGF